MKKILIGFFFSISMIVIILPTLHAQGILPRGLSEGTLSPSCEELIKNNEFKPIFDNQDGLKKFLGAAGSEGVSKREVLSDILGCAIRTGHVRLYMIPFFITYLIQFLLTIAGIIAVLFVVLGGYRYVLGGLTEDKESGKKTIQNALIGLVVALSAWIVVNFIQVALTS